MGESYEPPLCHNKTRYNWRTYSAALSIGVRYPSRTSYKDSGNDLIAIRGQHFKAIQVRTTTGDRIDKPDGPEQGGPLYDILAVVKVPMKDGKILVHEAEIYLFGSEEVLTISRKLSGYPQRRISSALVDELFGNPC